MASVDQEYKKDPKLKKEDVKNLMEWVEKQPHLPKITELQAILFLHSCYYSNEQAKLTIDNFFTVKTICTDMFGGRTPDVPSVLETADVSLVTIMPEKTPEGYSVLYLRLLDCDPTKYNFAHQLRSFDMVMMRYLMLNGTTNGVVMVLDMQGVVFGHLTRLNILVMKKFLYYLQDALPIRIKGLHFVHVVSFMDKILALMKPFMKKELLDMLSLHTESMNTLYKVVPQKIMPKEYNGNGPSFKELRDKEVKLLHENKDFHKFEETQTVDEKKRPGKPKQAKDFFGVEGTFKKLELD